MLLLQSCIINGILSKSFGHLKTIQKCKGIRILFIQFFAVVIYICQTELVVQAVTQYIQIILWSR